MCVFVIRGDLEEKIYPRRAQYGFVMSMLKHCLTEQTTNTQGMRLNCIYLGTSALKKVWMFREKLNRPNLI